MPGAGSVTRAFTGVFDPRASPASATQRARLGLSLEPDGPATRLEDGPLALAWTRAGDPGTALQDRTVCVLDGHVYNLSELTDDAAGNAADALAHLYERFGADLLPRLRGDFALVFWDRLTHTGLIARDQLGARPLHLHDSSGCLSFASELRNLTRLLPTTPTPDAEAFGEWLDAGMPAGDRTLFEGVRSLPPATYVELGLNGASTPIRYWEPRYRPPVRMSAQDASASAREALFRSVRRRATDADTSAVLLSGGIDSSSVAGVAAAALDEEQRPRRAYTVTFPLHPEIDEGPLTASVAAYTGLATTGLHLESGSVVGGALDYMDAWETPPSSPNLFFLRPILDRAAADGTRVLFDGEGGDAVFWFVPALLADRLRSGRLVSAWRLAGRFPEYGRPTTWRSRANHLRQWGRSGEPGATPRWWRGAVDAMLGPGSRLMHDVSRRHGAMAGIEPRHPLFDVDLIELGLSLPPELAFDRRYNRPVLRAAVEGLVPEEIRTRPYKSRVDPVFSDAIQRDLPVIERLLCSSGSEIRGLVPDFAPRELLDFRPAGVAGLRNWCTELWQLAMAECWLRSLAGQPSLPVGAKAHLSPTNAELSPL